MARQRSKSPAKAEKRTMAYFLKDRPEGLPMPERVSPSKSKTSPTKRPYNTRSASTASASSSQQSMARMVAPRLKLVDGKMVLDESRPAVQTREDLTAGMQVVQEDPNRYFTSATYSKRAAGSNRWSIKETDLFYEALSMCGTDFSMIATLFPHRNRNQIKGKFKIEEKNSPHRISTALSTQKKLDVNAFALKLAKVLGQTPPTSDNKRA